MCNERPLSAARPRHDGLKGRSVWRYMRLCVLTAALLPPCASIGARADDGTLALEPILQANAIVILGDVKHGVRDRIAFFSSEALFASLARAGVRNIAVEMPRVLGRQAMGIETEEDVATFAQDVIRTGRWHFSDPDNRHEDAAATQHRVAYALGRQVFLAKRLGINPIFYDFNNPLGGFATHNDPIYRCMAELTPATWAKYGLDGKIGKADRDAAIMRERFSHDGELAGYIEREVASNGGGKLVVIPGYAHSVLPGGLSDQLERKLGTRPAVIAVFADPKEQRCIRKLPV